MANLQWDESDASRRSSGPVAWNQCVGYLGLRLVHMRGIPSSHEKGDFLGQIGAREAGTHSFVIRAREVCQARIPKL